MRYTTECVAVRLIRDGEPEPRVAVTTPFDVFSFMRGKVTSIGREHFYVLHLNTRHKIVSYECTAQGTVDSCIVNPREVFQGAILANARSIVLVHNHPSGDPLPSPEDRQITRTLADAGRLLGIPVIDHIVIGDGYYSFAEHGEI